LHTNWSILGLGAMLTQLDNDGWEFVVAYASQSNYNTEAKYSSYEKACLVVDWVVYFLGVICMVAHLLWLLITRP